MEKDFSPGDPVEVTEGRFKGRTGQFKKYGCSVFPEYCYIIFDKRPRERTEKTQFIELKVIQMSKKTALSKGINALLDQKVTETNSAATEDTIKIPLSQLVPSETNPRKSFDEDALTDLAKSMDDIGLLQPITVRPGSRIKEFEIVAGERRYRAAKMLNWATISCSVRNIPDEQVLEIQIIENLQREDVSPMDEARAFASILQRENFDWLCSRIHKSKKYITDRLKLNELIEEAQGYVGAATLPLTHAIMISKLPPEEQKKCIDKCVEDEFFSDRKICILTIDKLREFIDDHLLVDLEKASFDLDSEDLLPAAGSCLKCPKRTCNQNLLFQEITEDDKCTDPGCFHDKVDANIKLSLKTAKEEYGKENVLSGAIHPYNNGMIKVKGLQVPYSETKKKKGDQISVVITKAEGLNQGALGKTVFIDKKVLADKEQAKEEIKASGNSSSRGLSWEDRQKEDFTKKVYPRLQLAQQFINADSINNSEEVYRHFLRERFDRLNEEAVVGLEVLLLGTTPESPEALFDFANGLEWSERMSLIDKLIDRLLPIGFERIAVILSLIGAVQDDDDDTARTQKERDEEEVTDLNWKEIIDIIDPSNESKRSGSKKGNKK